MPAKNSAAVGDGARPISWMGCNFLTGITVANLRCLLAHLDLIPTVLNA